MKMVYNVIDKKWNKKSLLLLAEKLVIGCGCLLMIGILAFLILFIGIYLL